MGVTKSTSWKDLRAKGKPNEEGVARHLERMKAEERAYRLREIRESAGITQSELARRLNLTQPTISALESGDLDRSGLATLRAYIGALGGTLEVTARFGEERLLVSGN